MNTRKLKVGDWVEVRSKEEILATLDRAGKLNGMPFMPEMWSFCGKRFRVHKSAHKTCDTVFPIRGRSVEDAIHLETRCDGQAHGGCQAGCLIFWKEAWLKPVGELANVASSGAVQDTPRVSAGSGCSELNVTEACVTRRDGGEPVYSCQATQLPYATKDLAWWDMRQYVEDYASGNVGAWKMFCGLVYASYYGLSHAGIGLGPIMRWFYNLAHPLWRGTLFPRETGTITAGRPTPTGALNLVPGESVRVKSHQDILQTLNTEGKNRGMVWDAEMLPYCGKTYKVLKRVTHIINEKTGEMQEMKNPCIILDTVVCQAKYSHCRMFCPRSIYPYWREIWLERVPDAGATAPKVADHNVLVTSGANPGSPH